jgi:serine protease
MDDPTGTALPEAPVRSTMKRTLGLLLALITLPLFAEEGQRYLIATRGRPDPERARVVANADSHRIRTFRNVNAFAATLTASEVAELRRSSHVELVTPVVKRFADELEPTTNAVDFELLTSWGIDAIHAPEVWPVTRGANINVAVLDTGIDINHPDLKDGYAGGYNSMDPSKSPQDDNKHGTHVAGVIAARANGLGVVGVAPEARIWAVKVLDNLGTGSDETVTAGIDWVIEKAKSGGLWVINMSLGANAPSEIERRAVERALSQGIVVVASAGNRTSFIRYPGRYPGVIAVGAVDNRQQRADFSSHGYGLSVMAPGAAIHSTLPQGSVRTADVRGPEQIVPAFGLIGSPLGSMRGTFLYAGHGFPEDFPSDIAGHIALIERGEIPFSEKSFNAKEAGATAVVIINNVPASGTETWTLLGYEGDPLLDYDFPLTVGVQRDEGLKLLNLQAGVEVGFRDESYGKLNGTSMASPHVAGIAALILALAPSTPALQVKYVLERTAHDMETVGWDTKTGWGAVDALAAAKYVAPARFNVPPPTPLPVPRRRAVH